MSAVETPAYADQRATLAATAERLEDAMEGAGPRDLAVLSSEWRRVMRALNSRRPPHECSRCGARCAQRGAFL